MIQIGDAVGRVLLVDDDADVLAAGVLALRKRGWDVKTARDPRMMWDVLSDGPVDVILLDLNFRAGDRSGEEGLQALNHLLAAKVDAAILIVTAHSGVNIAVSALRLGADDFVMKPWNNDRLSEALTEAVAVKRRKSGQILADEQADSAGWEVLAGGSDAVHHLRTKIEEVARTSLDVLLIGEPGVGKNAVARSIHQKSKLRTSPFIVMADFADMAERWGSIAQHEARAPSFVHVRSLGFPTAASPDNISAALLARHTSRIVVSITGTRTLEYLPMEFRKNCAEILVPALRHRRGDIPILVETFSQKSARSLRRPYISFTPAVKDMLANEAWPRNLDELAARIEKIVAFSSSAVCDLDDITPSIAVSRVEDEIRPGDDLNLGRVERLWVETALQRCGFNVSQAARDLGITRAALYRRMQKHGL